MITELIAKYLCLHEWKEIKHSVVVDSNSKAFQVNNIPAYHIYLYLCKKCGKFKYIKFGG